uniref:Uncharacterized protein n=1 Tax=Aegilops tauschii TaxID=37682 RepID=M8C1X8_AEGTA
MAASARRAEKELDVVGVGTTETTGGEVVRQDSSINTRGSCVARGDVRDMSAQYGPCFVRTWLSRRPGDGAYQS